MKVKDGKAVYERDSVLFERIEYSWPLLAGLMLVASVNNNKLNVLDFGGSLGSTYFQNRKFLRCLSKVTWNIVEQEKTVECGKKHFEDNELKFFFNIDDCFNQNPDINVIILSGVIQYIEKPYELLNDLTGRNTGYIIIDRVPLPKGGKDRITVQKIPAEIYGCCLPAWLLNRDAVLKIFTGRYELLEEFEGSDESGPDYAFKGFIFRLKRP